MTCDPSGPAPPPKPVYAQGKSHPPPQSQLPLEKVKALVTEAFTCAAERHIEVSDGLEIFVVEPGKGVRVIPPISFDSK
ncbi:hypothetical protein PtB15_16B327 [Puccinia triticina]|nr:hypothetical protein PtB15_16B327 [Puccinia triticina]